MASVCFFVSLYYIWIFKAHFASHLSSPFLTNLFKEGIDTYFRLLSSSFQRFFLGFFDIRFLFSDLFCLCFPNFVIFNDLVLILPLFCFFFLWRLTSHCHPQTIRALPLPRHRKTLTLPSLSHFDRLFSITSFTC